MPKLPAGIRHTFWSLADTVSYPVLYFATVPLLIRWLGTVGFGFWMVLSTFIVVLQLFNLSSGYTAVKHIAQARASGRPEALHEVVSGLLRIALLQLGGSLLVGAALMLIIGATGWFGASGIRHAPLCWLLAAAMSGLRFVEQVLQHIVKALERFRAAAILNTGYRCGSLLLTIAIAAACGPAIYWLLIGNLLFMLAYLAVHGRYLLRLLPRYRLSLAASGTLLRQLAGYGVWPWLQTVLIVCCFQADRFWVSAYAGLAEVSAYGLVATMINHINIIFSAMVGWASPRITAIHAEGGNPATEYHFMRALLTVFSILSLLAFYWSAPYVFTRWLGPAQFRAMAPYIQGFTGFELAFVQTIMPFYYLNGAGRERAATYATLLCCGACFAGMMSGLWLFHSTVAMVRGMTIGICLTVPVFNALANRQLEDGYPDRQLALDMLPVLAAVGLIYSQSLFLSLALLLAGSWTLIRFYIIPISQPTVWKQVLGSGKTSL